MASIFLGVVADSEALQAEAHLDDAVFELGPLADRLFAQLDPEKVPRLELLLKVAKRLPKDRQRALVLAFLHVVEPDLEDVLRARLQHIRIRAPKRVLQMILVLEPENLLRQKVPHHQILMRLFLLALLAPELGRVSEVPHVADPELVHLEVD